ncbi:MAG: hypothetical protein ACRDJ9_26090, partial [Dehalococcoidia bacterium]
GRGGLTLRSGGCGRLLQMRRRGGGGGAGAVRSGGGRAGGGGGAAVDRKGRGSGRVAGDGPAWFITRRVITPLWRAVGRRAAGV